MSTMERVHVRVGSFITFYQDVTAKWSSYPCNYIARCERAHDLWRKKAVGLRKSSPACYRWVGVTVPPVGITSDLLRNGFWKKVLQQFCNGRSTCQWLVAVTFPQRELVNVHTSHFVWALLAFSSALTFLYSDASLLLECVRFFFFALLCSILQCVCVFCATPSSGCVWVCVFLFFIVLW